MNTEDYKTKARESGILVGDRVLITRKAEYGENGWNSARWFPEKDGTINEIGKVIKINKNWNFYVRFDKNTKWCYPYFVLKRVHRSPIVPRFSIGDQVLINRSWEEGEYGTRVYFNKKEMTETIGKVVEIVEVLLTDNNEFTYSVNFENRDVFSYPEFVLKEPTNKPNPDFEFEPFDTLLHITGPTLSR